MSWIKSKVEAEIRVRDKGPAVWAEVRQALAADIAAYNAHYSGGIHVARVDESGSVAMNFALAGKSCERSLHVHFDPIRAQVVVCTGGRERAFHLVTDGQTVYLAMDGKPLGPALASRLILEPFLFPVSEDQ